MNNQERSSSRVFISVLMSRAPGRKRRPPIRIFYQSCAASATILSDMGKDDIRRSSAHGWPTRSESCCGHRGAGRRSCTSRSLIIRRRRRSYVASPSALSRNVDSNGVCKTRRWRTAPIVHVPVDVCLQPTALGLGCVVVEPFDEARSAASDASRRGRGTVVSAAYQKAVKWAHNLVDCAGELWVRRSWHTCSARLRRLKSEKAGQRPQSGSILAVSGVAFHVILALLGIRGHLDFERPLWTVNLDYEGFRPYAVTFAKVQRGCPVCDESKIAELQVGDSAHDGNT